MADDWKKQSKGNAKVYTHPRTENAVVVNFIGVSYRGEFYPSLAEAKAAAEKEFGPKAE